MHRSDDEPFHENVRKFILSQPDPPCVGEVEHFVMDPPYPRPERCINQSDDFLGEPVYAYTRAQAIADGVIIDLTTAADDKGQLLCHQAGFKVPVAITPTAWLKTIEAGGIWKQDEDGEVLEFKGGQSLTGRLWDVLWMLRVASGKAAKSERIHFQVLVDVNGDGCHEIVRLWALCGPGDDAQPVITIMVDWED
jgi:hypothetical protein